MTSEDTIYRASLTPIIQTLEAQLIDLDQLGAHIAAAQVDAAINQLRRDQTMIQRD